MTLQLRHSECPYIWGKFDFLYYQCVLSRAQELQQLYEHVDDVDLFVGMFSERPMKGALVGPITLCIVGDQFARLKKGDRFFYDLGGQQGEAAFTPSQLTEVGIWETKFRVKYKNT